MGGGQIDNPDDEAGDILMQDCDPRDDWYDSNFDLVAEGSAVEDAKVASWQPSNPQLPPTNGESLVVATAVLDPPGHRPAAVLRNGVQAVDSDGEKTPVVSNDAVSGFTDGKKVPDEHNGLEFDAIPGGRTSSEHHALIDGGSYAGDKEPAGFDFGNLSLNPGGKGPVVSKNPLVLASEEDKAAQVYKPRPKAQVMPKKVEPSTSNCLYTLMQINLDSQDLSFVEKVTLLQGEIFSLCKHVLPNSVRHQGREKYLIEFAKLNKSSLRVVGYYGDKTVMMDIFRTHRIVETSTLCLMEKGDFNPGLYASLRGMTLHVFYWHQGRGHNMRVASRKDISCNFVRYLVELCHVVHICLDSPGLGPLLTNATKSVFVPKKRTRRIKISTEKASENDLKFRPGWKKELPLLPSRSRQTSTVLDVQMAEGCSRAAVLVATPRLPQMSVRLDEDTIKTQAVSHHIAKWKASYNLDVRDLDDKSFTVLLEYAQKDGYQGLLDLKKTQRKKAAALAATEYKTDDLRVKEQSLLLSLFEKEVSLYLKRHFPLEENLLRSQLSQESPNISYPTVYGSQHQGVGDDMTEQGQAITELDNRRSLGPGAPINPDGVKAEAASLLERDFCGFWTGIQGDSTGIQQLIFSGSKITFRNVKDGHYTSQFQCYTVHDYSGQSAGDHKRLSPLLFGEEYFLKEIYSNIRYSVKFTAKDSACSVGPVTSGRPVFIRFNEGHNLETGGLKVLELPCADPVDRWMHSLAGEGLSSLRHKASLTERGLAHFRVLFSEEIVFAYQLPLIRAMMSGSFEGFPRSSEADLNNLDVFKREWFSFVNNSAGQNPPTADLSPAVETECMQAHNTNRSVFKRNVMDMVSRTYYSLLHEKVSNDLKLQKEELTRQGKAEVSEYLSRMRHFFTTQHRDNPGLSIKTCTLNKSYRMWRSDDLHFTYSTQVQEKENLTWSAIELALLKKDSVPRHGNNENQVVLIPEISDHRVPLVELDSDESRLLKVVYLRAGSALVFIETFVESPLLSVYYCRQLGTDLTRAKPKAQFRKLPDLIAFDEGSKLLAMYVKSTKSIKFYRFDESYSNLDPTGIETYLSKFNTGNTLHDLMWMRFAPGKAELVMIDSSNCARLLEVTQSPMLRGRHIDLPFVFTKACISADGSCLIVLHKSQGPNHELNSSAAAAPDESSCTGLKPAEHPQMLTFEVYWLETMTLLKSHGEPAIKFADVQTLEAKVVRFGTQMQLLILDRINPSFLHSIVLDSSSASEVLNMKVEGSAGSGLALPNLNPNDQKSCPELDFVYHIFDKYSTSPPLTNKAAQRGRAEVEFSILLNGKGGPPPDLGEKCETYVRESLDKLRAEKAKDFSDLTVTVRSQALEPWLLQASGSDGHAQGQSVAVGTWIQRLMCLVPLQIARAENNGLKPLRDGLQIPSHMTYDNAVSLVDIIRFGNYESLLENWKGDIKVVSSMGKQSSGKSYLLNHLSGSLLDVAGGRCTDGVWMTLRPTQDCLYVLLDFEGLGSFERSEQEDMLLSIFNAAVSNITVFNKKDFHLDKETESVFEKFQSGVNLVKKDDKLFQGLFYIAIKDVDVSDVEDLKGEFQDKILQICSKSRQNFLTNMYGGEVEIAAMPPFQRSEYHDSIKDIAATVHEKDASYQNGLIFMRDLKLVLAQISAKDWTPIDSKRVACKIFLLRKHWETAISSGCLAALADADASNADELVNFDTGDIISERLPLQGGDNAFDIKDTGILLSPSENQEFETVLDPLRILYERICPRDGQDDEAWHTSFETFLAALAERRKERVLEWIRANTADFEKDGDVKNLVLEAVARLTSLQQGLTLCSCKCSRCSLRCIQKRSHSELHTCRTDHKCSQTCTYCEEDHRNSPSEQVKVGKCRDAAGHQGPHHCQEKEHTCGKECSYFGKASNCNTACAEKVNHTGDHKCNSRQHMCRSTCSLRGCRNSCVSPFDQGKHYRHACHEKMCPEKCTVAGCKRNCASMDHFHSEEPGLKHHFCGHEHTCLAKCEAPGICEVDTALVKKKSTFHGLRSTFEYDHVSEQNGIRKACCIPIPPFEESHLGPHLHTENKDIAHFCDVRCHACGYFCNLPIGHIGDHNTNHGNMKHVYFVAESEEIEIHDRKYAWGESGRAEMCNMHCKSQGRGHIHLITCLSKEGGACADKVIAGARHETCKYGPDQNVPKDELTHAAFWKHMRFKDPCSDEERNQFALCNHRCSSSVHKVEAGSAFSSVQQTSYCVEPLWHKKVSKGSSPQVFPWRSLSTADAVPNGGFITDDGHRFACDHSSGTESHVIFVIDVSSSMGRSDCVPTMAKFTRNRLGCVHESILRFIQTRQAIIIQDFVSVVVFDDSATKLIDCVPISETIVDQILSHKGGRGTTYSSGLRLAKDLLVSSSQNPAMRKRSPVVIFLSDGGNCGGNDPVQLVKHMKDAEPELILHTIKFGHEGGRCNEILTDMAAAGSGSFQVSLDNLQLAQSFVGLANSLRDNVSALLQRNDQSHSCRNENVRDSVLRICSR